MGEIIFSDFRSYDSSVSRQISTDLGLSIQNIYLQLHVVYGLQTGWPVLVSTESAGLNATRGTSQTPIRIR